MSKDMLGLHEFIISRSYQPVLFGRRGTFNSTEDQLSFSTAIKELPVVDANPHLNELLIEYCEQAIAGRAKQKASSH